MRTTNFYIAAAGGERSGIHWVFFDHGRSRIEARRFTPFPGASYMIPSADGGRLYVAASVSANFENDGEVATFAVEDDGRLVFLNSMASGGLSCCHLAATDRFLYCANYRGGTFAEFALAPDGGLSERRQLIEHSGSGADPRRQESAHPHFVALTPDNQYLAVVDLGCDGVFFYRFDPVRGIARDSAKFSSSYPGAGPRHLVFDAEGRIAYVANELGNTVSVCDYADGELSSRQDIATLPEGFADESTVAAIRLSASGDMLYVSNRGHDSIAVFAVLKDGLLESRGYLSAHGERPRDFVLFADDSRIAVAHESGGTLAVFEIEEDGSGEVADVAKIKLAGAERPICVIEAAG